MLMPITQTTFLIGDQTNIAEKKTNHGLPILLATTNLNSTKSPQPNTVTLQLQGKHDPQQAKCNTNNKHNAIQITLLLHIT